MITVIIPHLNDAGLEACLTSLEAQTGYDGAWEILVVDNGSDLPPVELCNRFERVRLLSEPSPGPGPARNLGAAQAKGDVLAFTDADCTVCENWLAEIEIGFADQSICVLGGAVEVSYVLPESPKFTEPFERVYSFRNKNHIAEGYSASANLAVRAEVFEEVGGFGGREIAEDQDWGLRASRLGYAPKYWPAMVVHNSSRENFAALLAKWARHIAHEYNVRSSNAAWGFRAVCICASCVCAVSACIEAGR